MRTETQAPEAPPEDQNLAVSSELRETSTIEPTLAEASEELEPETDVIEDAVVVESVADPSPLEPPSTPDSETDDETDDELAEVVKQCPSCSSEIPAEALFCPICGATIQ